MSVLAERHALTRRVDAFIRGGTAVAFDAVASDVLAFQRRAIPALARLWPADSPWDTLRPLPIGAMKALELFAGTADEPRRVFESSGTSGQPKSRAVFSHDGLALMDVAIDVNARERLFPEPERRRILALAPSPAAVPAMIMAAGVQRLMTTFGTGDSRFLVGPAGLELEALVADLERAESSQEPVTLVGASFGVVALLDALAAAGRRFRLPEGSRLMDAGGFKGRSREVGRLELCAGIGTALGIPASHCVNLLGMTELASQLYDTPPTPGTAPVPRPKRGPPWTRTRVLDPETLAPVAPGVTGLLCHLDLANVERPALLLTDDLGVAEPDGDFHVLGRARGAEAKGCSLTIEQLVSAAA